MSHKGFAPLLSGTGRFETNESKACDEFDEALRRIRFKCEMTPFDSNFID
jgi:hypothetical protein